jgi:hypothetical protein
MAERPLGRAVRRLAPRIPVGVDRLTRVRGRAARPDAPHQGRRDAEHYGDEGEGTDDVGGLLPEGRGDEPFPHGPQAKGHDEQQQPGGDGQDVDPFLAHARSATPPSGRLGVGCLLLPP